VKKAILVYAVAVVGLGLLAISAFAQKKTYPTTMTGAVNPVPGQPDKATYSGTLSSPNHACVKGRVVAISDNEAVFARAVVDSNGHWQTGVLPNQATGYGVFAKTLGKDRDQKRICGPTGTSF
jgi:hypothetical protein